MGIFNWTYYFDDNLASMFWGWGYWVVVVLMVGLVVAGLIVPKRTKKLSVMKRQITLRMAATANAVGWLMLVWLFFRFEGIQYLSWRFWPAILVLYMLYQIGWAIKFAKFDFPKKRASKITGQEKEIYLKKYLKR